MRSHYRVPLGAILLLLASTAWVLAADAEISLATDRPEAIYKVGEEITFVAHATKDGKPLADAEFEYTLSLDGGKTLKSDKGKFGATAVMIKSSLYAPGVLRCTVVYKGGEKPVVAIAGAAVDPYAIQPTATEPEDFKQFWQHNREKLDNIPMGAQLTLAPQYSDSYQTVYKISLANILGTRVYGWLGVPVNPGPHPAILTVPGAGVYPLSAGGVDWARRGFIAMSISVHNYPVDLPKEKYDELNAGALAGYPFQGKRSKRSYYFLTVFTGCMRAIDYLTSRSDWDGKTMIVTGSSQGGALSIVSAGLDPRVTAIAANVPAMCDHTGRFSGGPSGWPQLIPSDDPGDLVRTTAGYYDAAILARYIKCPTLMAVGLIDRTCPAMTVFAAYNAINAPKEMMVFPPMGHAVDPKYTEYREKWILEQAYRTKGSPAKPVMK